MGPHMLDDQGTAFCIHPPGLVLNVVEKILCQHFC